MYVVRRAFRHLNKMILPGSVVEPGSVKWFKTRLKDRYIIEVNAHNFDLWREYFKAKYGVELAPLDSTKTKESEPKDDSDKVTDVKEPTANAGVEKKKIVTVKV